MNEKNPVGISSRFILMVMCFWMSLFMPAKCEAFTIELTPVGFDDPVVITPCWPRYVEYEVKVIGATCQLSLHTSGLNDYSFSPSWINQNQNSILRINFPCWADQTYNNSYVIHVRGTTTGKEMAHDEKMLYIENIQVTASGSLHVRKGTQSTMQITVSPSPSNFPPLKGRTELEYQMLGASCSGTSYINYQCTFNPPYLNTASGQSTLTFLAPDALGQRCIRFRARYTPSDRYNLYTSQNYYMVVSDIPETTTGNSNSVGDTFAEMTTGVLPNFSDSQGWLEYGETTQYGNSTNPQAVSGTPQIEKTLYWRLDGLAPNTVYHYRAAAVNEWNETVYGADRTFTTGSVVDARISAVPASVDFGAIAAGTVSPDYTVTISNTGTTDLEISSIAVTGGDDGLFFPAVGTCSTLTPTIAPGTACTILLTFEPLVEGTFASTLRINSNSVITPQLDIPLAGEGTLDLGPNLAARKEVMQSSYEYGKNGTEAIDGDTNGDFADGSVSSTGFQDQAYWQVDLGDNYHIDVVKVYNRTDCCDDRLTDFDVKISTDGQTWQAFHVPGTAGSPTTVTCGGGLARYVRVQLRNSHFLSLAEVQIYGDGPLYDNLALGKPVTQSTNQFGKTGAEAVDGNTSGDWGEGSVSCTDHENQPSWTVDLEDVYQIFDIHVYNRTDCCNERLTDFDVKISEDGTTWETINVPGEGGSPTTVNFGGHLAKYVTVQLRGLNFLSLAEVQVMGKGPIRENIALGKTVTQSSYDFGTTGSEAVDGDTNGAHASGSMSHTQYEAQPWWRVDLGSSVAIEEVRVYNRTDCCNERLSNFEVEISQDGVTWETVLVPGPALRPSVINFSGHLGRYVRVRLTGTNFLSLPEVEVMIKR